MDVTKNMPGGESKIFRLYMKTRPNDISPKFSAKTLAKTRLMSVGSMSPRIKIANIKTHTNVRIFDPKRPRRDFIFVC